MIGYEPPSALPRDLLDDAEMQTALQAHDFGTVFRLARSRAKISYSKIAAECDIKPERVGTLARGRGKITTYEKIVRIADALRVPGYLLGLTPRPWEVDVSPAHSNSTQKGDTVRRRTFVEAASSTGLAAALPTLTTQPVPSRITTKVVNSRRARTARLRRLDDVLGGGDTWRVYLSEYQETKGLLRTASYSDTVRRSLLSLLAEQAQQAGWAAFDGGRDADALSLYKVSHAAAKEAGDACLEGNALAFLAYQTADRQAAVEITTRACQTITPHTPSGVQALLHERRAWACAVAGLTRETEHALDAATAALDTVDSSDPDPDWAAWVDRTELDIMSGRCWTELHRPLRAVPFLETALARYDDRHARDKALYLSWLATAYLTAGEVDAAATATQRALDLCSGVASVRPKRRLASVLEQLRRHPGIARDMARA